MFKTFIFISLLDLSTDFTEDNQRGEMMEKTTAKTEEEVAGRSLLDLVFSWSIRDVLNRDIYKNQVCMNAI